MAQLSRPYQIALLALAMLVLVWFVALRRPSSEPSSGSSAPSVSASSGSVAGSASSGSSSAGGSAAAKTSSVYHGAAPGVEGLTRDIQKAHGAVATSQRNAGELQSKSAQASGEAAGGGTAAVGASHSAASATRTHSGSAAAPSRTQTHTSASGAASSASKTTPVVPQRTPPPQRGSAAAAQSSSSTPAMQAVVAGELKHGKVVLLLFWSPRSADDAVVDQQVRAAAHKLGRRVVVHTASASQVGSFGSITRDIQVYQTPTLLIVNPKRTGHDADRLHRRFRDRAGRHRSARVVRSATPGSIPAA